MSYHLLLRPHKTRLFTLTLALVGLLNLMVPPVQSNPTSLTRDVVTRQVIVNENSLQENPLQGGSDLLNARVNESLARVPLSFQPNVGQIYSNVEFLARGDGYNLFLTPAGAVFDLRTKRTCDSTRYVDGASSSSRQQTTQCQAAGQAARVSVAMNLVGARLASRLVAQEESPTKVNYFIGNDPEKWRSQIPTYGRISHPDVYPGIDLFYYGSQRQLEYDFVVSPGADYRLIRLGFNGARRVQIDGAGDLLLHVKGGVLRQQRPVVYQNIEGRRREVEGRYIVLARNEIGFRIGAYDSTKPLIIDPVLLYSTYLGGTGFDEAFGVTANSSSIFISGSTSSVTLFPVTAGAYQTSLAGGGDAFVARLNHTSESTPFFTYITYLGGSGVEHGYGIAADEENNAYVVGDTTSTDFPTTPGSFRSSPVPSPRYVDSFVTKLNLTGSAIIYSTYLGGRGYDYARDIGVDTLGSAYVTGDSTSIDFPLDESGAVRTTPGGFPPHFTDEFDPPDAFVLGLNASGSDLIYTTFLGGPNRPDFDRGYGIAVGLGSQFVTGVTSSRVGFPLANAYQSPSGGGSSDAFVTRLEYESGHLFLRYSTYLGGNNSEQGKDIAVDSTGKVYVTGSTDSANFPTRNALQPVFRGGTCGTSPGRFVCHDAFVVKIDPYLSGNSSFLYGSYLGGRSDDLGNGITIDSSNNIYLTGETYSNDFPVRGFIPPDNQPLRSDMSGAGDVFITKLNARDGNTFAYAYSAYLGEYFDALTHIELSRDYGNGVAVDQLGNAYVVGQTSSNRFARGSVPYPTYRGRADAFVAKVQETPLDRIGSMIEMIGLLIKKGLLSQDEAKNLIVKLEVAMKQLDQGHTKPASNQMEDFVARLGELLKKGLFPPQEGKILIDRANEVINQLNPDLVKPQ